MLRGREKKQQLCAFARTQYASGAAQHIHAVEQPFSISAEACRVCACPQSRGLGDNNTASVVCCTTQTRTQAEPVSSIPQCRPVARVLDDSHHDVAEGGHVQLALRNQVRRDEQRALYLQVRIEVLHRVAVRLEARELSFDLRFRVDELHRVRANGPMLLEVDVDLLHVRGLDGHLHGRSSTIGANRPCQRQSPVVSLHAVDDGEHREVVVVGGGVDDGHTQRHRVERPLARRWHGRCRGAMAGLKSGNVHCGGVASDFQLGMFELGNFQLGK